MVEEGLFDKFPCEAAYGLHNMPQIPRGVFGVRHGTVTVHRAGYRLHVPAADEDNSTFTLTQEWATD